MKIKVDNSKKICKFGELENGGDVFYNKGDFNIKVASHNNKVLYNTVRLNDGLLYCTSFHEEVVPYQAELILRENINYAIKK